MSRSKSGDGSCKPAVKEKSSSVIRERKDRTKQAIFKDDFNKSLQQLISLKDENVVLKNKIKELQIEQATLSRQCKIQDARLAKASSSETIPSSVVQRLTVDIQNLTLMNREKTHKCETLERSLNETRIRLDIAHKQLQQAQEEVNSYQQGSTPSLKEHEKLSKEHKQLSNQKCELEHKIKVLEKSIKQHESSWNEQVKSLNSQLKSRDEEIDRLKKIISEKTRILDVKNIYSLRFKNAPESQQKTTTATGDSPQGSINVSPSPVEEDPNNNEPPTSIHFKTSISDLESKEEEKQVVTPPPPMVEEVEVVNTEEETMIQSLEKMSKLEEVGPDSLALLWKQFDNVSVNAATDSTLPLFDLGLRNEPIKEKPAQKEKRRDPFACLDMEPEETLQL